MLLILYFLIFKFIATIIQILIALIFSTKIFQNSISTKIFLKLLKIHGKIKKSYFKFKKLIYIYHLN